MSEQSPFQKLSARLGLGNSERLPGIWSMLCTDEEAAILLAMPGTIGEISSKTGVSPDRLESVLHELFIKGVVFERSKDGKTSYSPPRNFVQFHDATILWPDAPAEFIEKWKDFMDTEYPAFTKMIDSAGIGPFMRIIPINRAVEGSSNVLPYEHAANMIRESSSLAVTDCTCRKTQKKCDAPIKVCIQLNRGADYSIKRGTGKQINTEQALQILKDSEEAGLVHLSENRARVGNVICNCCPCCCQALNPLIYGNIKGLTAPSRYLATVDNDVCSSCGLCLDRCHTGALSMSDNGPVVVSQEKCIGCGLCSSVCEENAISLKDIRPTNFIP